MAEAIVLAVYIPPQLPGPGIAVRSMSRSPSSESFPAAWAPTASNTEMMSRRCVPGRMAPAEDEDRRALRARHGHGDAGHVLVTPAERDEAIEACGADHRFHGVRDQLARDERVAHPGRPHRDAVGDRDGVEEHALAT